MPSTGFLSPSAEAAGSGGNGDGFEINPTNAFANDGAFAEDTDTNTGQSANCANAGKDRHVYYDYGFSIPAGSTINGIVVRLDAWADKVNPGQPVMCVELSWDGGATWAAYPAKTTPKLGTSEATFFLGSDSDTWGRTWSVTDFTNANFRVRITNVSRSSDIRDFFLDWVPVQVTYTFP